MVRRGTVLNLIRHKMLSLCTFLSAFFVFLSTSDCLPLKRNELLAKKSNIKDTYVTPKPAPIPIVCTFGYAAVYCNNTRNITYKWTNINRYPYDYSMTMPTTAAPNRDYNLWIYVSGGLFLILITLVAISGFFIYRRHKQIARFAKVNGLAQSDRNEQPDKMHMNMNYMAERNQYINQSETIDVENCKQDPWEMTSNQLKIFEFEKLGSGAFCFVFKGKLEGKAPICNIQPSIATQNFEDCEVAVKKLPEYADDLAKNDFVQEIDFMKRIGYHRHLVSILGCITDPRVDPCLVIEYCANGDLLKYVRNRRLEIVDPTVDDDSALRFKDLLSFAWQISDGMDFLSSSGCIHRDVAARNVLVDEHKVAKIGDFGLCRLMDSTIYTTRGGRLPIKWMALESLQDYEYSTKTDVWSFGVLLYELFSLGAVPYSWIQPSDMTEYLRSGKRLDKPPHCADEVYSIMQECWNAKPDERPFFSDLKTKLGTLLSYATEEYGYLDIRKPSSGKYYQMVPNTNTNDLGELNAPNEYAANVEALYGSDAKDFFESIIISGTNLHCP